MSTAKQADEHSMALAPARVYEGHDTAHGTAYPMRDGRLLHGVLLVKLFDPFRHPFLEFLHEANTICGKAERLSGGAANTVGDVG